MDMMKRGQKERIIFLTILGLKDGHDEERTEGEDHFFDDFRI
jgi:hypothetical protein